jgi:hypothetical protein
MFGLDERLERMNAAGVDVSVLSCAPLGLCPDAGAAADLAAAGNDGLLSA